MSRRKSGLLLAGAALLLGLTACTGSSTKSESYAGAPAQAPMPNSRSGDSAGLGAGTGSGAGATSKQGQQQQPQQDSAPVQNRQLVQTARIQMTVPDPVAAVMAARGVATSLNGFTGQEESTSDNATITLRVPDQLAKLPGAKVTAQHKQADDVTDQVVDLDARLATQRASVDRMRALLAKANSVSEVAQVESELTRREADLESMEGRRAARGGQVALSTVVLQVGRETPPPAPKPAEQKAGFVSGLTGGWGAFGDMVNGILTALGALLPFLVTLGVAGVVFLYIRRKRRKAHPKPTPAPTAPTVPPAPGTP
jgi:hypothetical protein